MMMMALSVYRLRSRSGTPEPGGDAPPPNPRMSRLGWDRMGQRCGLRTGGGGGKKEIAEGALCVFFSGFFSLMGRVRRFDAEPDVDQPQKK